MSQILLVHEIAIDPLLKLKNLRNKIGAKQILPSCSVMAFSILKLAFSERNFIQTAILISWPVCLDYFGACYRCYVLSYSFFLGKVLLIGGDC